MSTQKIGWGILGTGRIAKTLAKAVQASSTGELMAVGSRTQPAAEAFAAEFKIPRAYGSYEAVLKDPTVKAVYISLPNHLHAEWTIRCAEAGKAILCEKPLGMNFPESMAMIEACRAAGVFMMEAFMYRCHPQTAKLAELIRSKAIGEVRLIQSAFSYNIGEAWENIRMLNSAGGGGIMDVGCYTTSMARLVAGNAIGQDFADPIEIKAVGHIGERSRIDEWSTASVKFPNDILASLSCGTLMNGDRTLRIWGSKGNIAVPNPWFPGEKDNQIIVQKDGDTTPEVIKVDAPAALYTVEVDTVAAAVHGNKPQAPAPCMTWADSISNMKMLDAWRRQIGLGFDAEAVEGMKATASGRPLAAKAGHKMPFAKIEGVSKPVSRVVMGSMIYGLGEMPLTFHMIDWFFENGGNCIDLAYVYGGGQSEKAVGQWVKARGNREQAVILTKGAHTPQCDPVNLTKQLHESLERLQMSYVDLYCMHRDNPEIPVGEFVDVLNEHKKAGLIRAFGGSNWSTQRIEEANAYAKAKGLTGFTLSSPNFSLATWNGPMWGGCITASDADSRAWYTKHQVPIFAWSSQAGGFFTGKLTAPGAASHPDWYVRDSIKTWVNETNTKKLARANELAAKKNTTATQIAMAYVLAQPFPTFALIGPRTIEETRTSMLGLEIKLTADECKYLNLET
ncbi:MAG: aldo/keto reductase [Planctomycetota bacterium]|nr:aldo/keto reductase [Planctomycetota bacterium]